MIGLLSVQHKFLICLLSVIVLVGLSGCEPLRKKFTRQKKAEKTNNSSFIPVLQPEDYPVNAQDPKKEYARHYSLFSVWFSDFASNYEQGANDRKLLYALDAALNELMEMKSYLPTAQSIELENIQKQIVFIRDEINRPQAFRNDARMKSEIRDVDRTYRKKLKPAAVEDLLTK